MTCSYDDLRVGDRVALDPKEYTGEMEFVIHNETTLDDIRAGHMGNVTFVSRPVYLTPERVVALENVWHEAMGTPGDDHDRAEIEDYNEVAAIIAEAKGEL